VAVLEDISLRSIGFESFSQFIDIKLSKYIG